MVLCNAAVFVLGVAPHLATEAISDDYNQACEKIAFLSSFLILVSISATSCLISYSVPPISTTVVVGCLAPRKYRRMCHDR